MGYPTMFYIHDDNKSNLSQVDNKSQLINNLLRDYFKIQSTPKMSIEEAQKRIEILKVEIEAENKIKELKNEL